MSLFTVSEPSQGTARDVAPALSSRSDLWSRPYVKATGSVGTAYVTATADQADGLKFTFAAVDQSRPAADYDWTFPGGTPAVGTDVKSQVVTYATAGAKTATLTVAAGAGPPPGGSYPITVVAVSGPRSISEMEAPAGETAAVEEEYPFNPSLHTVAEIEAWAATATDQELEAALRLEEADKNRTTAIAALGG